MVVFWNTGRAAGKYHAEKTVYDGITFDSKLECARYRELKCLEAAGEITHLRRQVEFELIPEQREPDTVGARGGIKKGRVIEQKCSYYADFVYDNSDGLPVVEDTKGIKTKEYRIKKKLVLFIFGLRINEIKRTDVNPMFFR